MVGIGRHSAARPRVWGCVGLSVLGAILVVVLTVGSAQAVAYSTDELAVVRLLNEYRADNGLGTLLVSDLCSDAAEKHALDMSTYGFRGHATVQSDYFQTGDQCAQRLARCGYDFHTDMGENIAYDYLFPADVVAAWQASSRHDDNMLWPGFQVVGIAKVQRGDSCYWVMEFGGYVDQTAHEVDDVPTSTSSATSTTSTTLPSTTTTAFTTTTTASTTTTTASTITTTLPRAGVSFADVQPSSPYYEAVTALANAGILAGKSDGLFHPGDFVTRAQFAKIIVLALGKHTGEIEQHHPTFPDVPNTGAYPFDFVEEAVALRIIQGRSDGTFGPGAGLTRLQLTTMLVRAGGSRLSVPPVGFTLSFMDVPTEARRAVILAVYNHLLSGKSTTLFDPYSQATRGQVVNMVHQLRHILLD